MLKLTILLLSYPDWDRKKEKQPEVDFAQIVNLYVEKRHQNTIPNPYKYGKGHSVWPDYTGINNLWDTMTMELGSLSLPISSIQYGDSEAWTVIVLPMCRV